MEPKWLPEASGGRLGGSWGPLGGSWGLKWGQNGSRRPLEGVLAALGALLAALGALLAPLLAALGPSNMEPTWGQHGSRVGSLEAVLTRNFRVKALTRNHGRP